MSEMISFTKTEKTLLDCLKAVLCESMWEIGDIEGEVLSLAQKHAVLSLLYPLAEHPDLLSENDRIRIENESHRTVQQSYHLMFFTHYVVERLREVEIAVVVLKGVAASRSYPVPELRKSGDVDLLLLNPEQLEEAQNCLLRIGLVSREETSNHHKVWRSEEGINLELHVMLAEPFDNATINDYLENYGRQLSERVSWKDVMGLSFPVLDPGDHAFQLLLHMLQHYLRSGFGVKLLCDWVVFWNGEVSKEQREHYLSLVNQTGLSGFSDMVTLLCGTYLGLEGQRMDEICTGVFQADPDLYMREILDSEEFGHREVNRMVVLRGTAWTDYMREFHHQMCLNHPKNSRHKYLWPALWMHTFLCFCRNNRKIRKTSLRNILQTAGERSRLTKNLKLYESNEKDGK